MPSPPIEITNVNAQADIFQKMIDEQREKGEKVEEQKGEIGDKKGAMTMR